MKLHREKTFVRPGLRGGVLFYLEDFMVYASHVRVFMGLYGSMSRFIVLFELYSRFLMNREPQEIPLSESLVVSELEAWKAHVVALSRPDLSAPTKEQQDIYTKLLKKAGEEKSPLGVGPDIVAGAHLPSHSDVHHSCLTGQRIQVSCVSYCELNP